MTLNEQIPHLSSLHEEQGKMKLKQLQELVQLKQYEIELDEYLLKDEFRKIALNIICS